MGINYSITASPYTIGDGAYAGIYFDKKSDLIIGQEYTLMCEIKSSKNTIYRMQFESMERLETKTVGTEWERIIIRKTPKSNFGTLIIYNWVLNTQNVTLDIRNIQLNIEGIYAETKTSYGGNKLELDAPERDDWTFLGWYTDPIYGDQVIENTDVPMEDTTYYAHWRYDNYE